MKYSYCWISGICIRIYFDDVGTFQVHQEIKRSAKGMGLITAHPNPVPLGIPSGLVSTTLQWISAGTDLVEVRVGAPDGALFSRSVGTGYAETGPWVHNGMVFYLQDVSNGKALIPEHTLSTVSIQTALEPLTPTPDLYPFAAFLGQRLGCSHIICIGCYAVKHMAQFHSHFEIIGIDSDDDFTNCRKQNPSCKWIKWHQENPGIMPLEREILKKSILLCTDIHHFENMPVLFDCIKRFMDFAPACVLAMNPDKITNCGIQKEENHNNHVKEVLDPKEFELMHWLKPFNIAFVGRTSCSIFDFTKEAQAAILGKNVQANESDIIAPENFHAVAIMTAYNEEDIIIPSIKHLIDQGIRVYLIDNWSTDLTYTLAKAFLGKGLIGIERFPADSPPLDFSLQALLKRVEVLTTEIQADWFIHHDVDEIRESPWAGISLKDGLYAVDKAGFNCVDHTVIEFQPTDDGFVPGSDFKEHFKYFEFGSRPGDFLQIKAWKNSGQAVSLADSGGHEVCFEGRRVYPYKFLLKHYQIRSQSHGEKKVYKERKARWNPSEKARGWHAHYDDFREGHSFIRSAAELEYFDEAAFHQKYLIERLSGTGILRKILVAQKTNSVAAPDDASANLKLINDLVCRNDRLSAQIEDLETKKKEHELFLQQLSNKWYIRCIVFINRLLGRAHRLKSYDSVKTI